MRLAIALCVVLIAVGGTAWAHRVKIFATVQDGAIEGQCYSSSGGRPAGAKVEFLGPSGERLGEALTDAQGRFRFRPTAQVDHRIVLDTGDGHRAEFVVKAAELAGAPRDDRPVQATAEKVAENPDLARLVAEAVRRELRPLREQIDRWESRTMLRDILGGIGYIFGLAGLAALLRRRKTA